jgi:hypothetical protein
MIAPDDLEVGMLVTVIRGTNFYFNGFETKTVPNVDMDGNVYTVAAINLPFVAMRTDHGTVFPMDMRRYELGRVTPEYAKAMGPNPDRDAGKVFGGFVFQPKRSKLTAKKKGGAK